MINIIIWIIVGLLVLFIFFILSGIKKITARPLHKGIAVTLGQPQDDVVLDEGYNFFPFYPFFSSYIEESVERVPQEIPVQEVRTPDKVELEIPASVVWSPDWQESKNFFRYVIENGGKTKVSKQLEEIVQQRIRQWAISPIEGPQDWEEALAAGDEAIAVIAKTIAPDTDIDARELIAQLRSGNGALKSSALGIIIHRITIGKIKVLGEVAKEAEQKAKEKVQKAVEEVEVDNFLNLVAKTSASLEVSKKEASEIILLEMGKIKEAKKEIHENQIHVSETTQNMIENIFGKISDSVINYLFKKDNETAEIKKIIEKLTEKVEELTKTKSSTNESENKPKGEL